MALGSDLSALFFYVLLFAIPLIILKFRGFGFKKSISFMRLNDFSFSNLFWRGLVCFVFSFSLVALELLLLGLFGLDDSNRVEAVLQTFSPLLILFTIFLAPIAEEVFFRGFLMRVFGIWPSSAVFGLVHYFYGSIAEVIGAFTLALGFSFFVRRWNSLYPAIFAHFLVNFIAILSFFFKG